MSGATSISRLNCVVPAGGSIATPVGAAYHSNTPDVGRSISAIRSTGTMFSNTSPSSTGRSVNSHSAIESGFGSAHPGRMSAKQAQSVPTTGAVQPPFWHLGIAPLADDERLVPARWFSTTFGTYLPCCSVMSSSRFW
jgi:hypothetical protein